MVASAEVRWAGLSVLLLVVAAAGGAAGAPPWLVWAVYAGCFASGGWGPALAGLAALRDGRLDVDLLMIVAGLGAAGIGQAFDGGLLIVIFATSGALEAVATKRTEDSVRSLLALAPEQATRVTPDGGEELVDTASLAVGDLVLVRPGESIGADGAVVAGASEVDQASVTGEPLPLFRTTGDGVFAGTLNGEGSLTVRVSRPAAESVVARIVAMVAEASATKARAQLFIEKVEQRYSVGVVAATLGLFLVPLAAGAEVRPTLLRAMTFMIVASPCAVVLATMPPLLSAIANAGRHGVLVKSAVVMERLATTTVVAFDKTGTLTEGTPRVSEIVPLAGSGLDADRLLGLAAAAEHQSEHPLARAVVAAAGDRGVRVPAAEAFRSTPGRGVHAVVDGHRVEIGSPRLLDTDSGLTSEARRLVANLEAEGRTAVVVMVDGSPAGVLGLADRLRPDARQAVAALAGLTGRAPLLLTGDNAGAARRLAEDVGITDVHAGLLPQDKVALVRQLQAAGEQVLVVGDGVNDAPALAAAHLGVAMGGHGSDLALETADAVIVRDELAALPTVIDLSRRARRTVIQNLVFAATAVVGLVAIDLFGTLPLPLGVAGHEGSTVIVGLNGLRLLRTSAWTLTGARPPRRRPPPLAAPTRPDDNPTREAVPR
ncbi:MAG: heavy metal translocating P-type ATPase [Acidimicrobiales bacterium]